MTLTKRRSKTDQDAAGEQLGILYGSQPGHLDGPSTPRGRRRPEAAGGKVLADGFLVPNWNNQASAISLTPGGVAGAADDLERLDSVDVVPEGHHLRPRHMAAPLT